MTTEIEPWCFKARFEAQLQKHEATDCPRSRPFFVVSNNEDNWDRMVPE